MNWNFNYPAIIQGDTEFESIKLTDNLESYGIDIVGYVRAGHTLQSIDIVTREIPYFDLVENALISQENVKISLICVPAHRVLDAGLEAIAAGIQQLIIVTPDVPPLDTIALLQAAKTNNVAILGPGSSGIMIVEQACFGMLSRQYFQSGNVGIIGYGKALIYEIVWELNRSAIGQSLVVSLGTDKIIGSDLIYWLEMLDRDDSTEVIVLIQLAQDIDEVGMEFISSSIDKPVICYLAGSQAPADRVFRKGIAVMNNYLSNSIPTTSSFRKIITNLKKSGITIANKPSEIPSLINRTLTTSKPEKV